MQNVVSWKSSHHAACWWLDDPSAPKAFSSRALPSAGRQYYAHNARGEHIVLHRSGEINRSVDAEASDEMPPTSGIFEWPAYVGLLIFTRYRLIDDRQNDRFTAAA